MKKRTSFLALLFFLFTRLYALTVGVIVPEPLKGILVEDLSKQWFDNVIFFEEISELDDDMSVTEMTVYGQRHDFDFVVYGFSESDDVKCSAELRLLNIESRKNEKFFYACDSIDAVSRLSATLARHIHDYLCEKFSLHETEFKHLYKLDFTLSGGYWTFTHPKWADLFLGEVSSHAGLEFHPAFDFQISQNNSIDFSLALNAGYHYGKGKNDRYEAVLHAADFSMPFIFNWNPTKIHSIRFGVGPSFQLGVIDWTPLYQDEENKKIYQWGVTSFVQGRVFVSRIIGFSLGVAGSHYFVKNNVPEFSAELGFVLTPLKKESRR